MIPLIVVSGDVSEASSCIISFHRFVLTGAFASDNFQFLDFAVV